MWWEFYEYIRVINDAWSTGSQRQEGGGSRSSPLDAAAGSPRPGLILNSCTSSHNQPQSDTQNAHLWNLTHKRAYQSKQETLLQRSALLSRSVSDDNNPPSGETKIQGPNGACTAASQEAAAAVSQCSQWDQPLQIDAITTLWRMSQMAKSQNRCPGIKCWKKACSEVKVST